MNRIFTLLAAAIVGVALVPLIAQADPVNPQRWDNFCKNKPRLCDIAMNMCESDYPMSCEDIQQAFLMNRRLPPVQQLVEEKKRAQEQAKEK